LFGRGSWAEARRITDVLRTETVGGMLLLGAAVIALIWANSPWSGLYHDLSGLRVGPAAWHLDLSLPQWAADGLLASFFVAGLELARISRACSGRRVVTDAPNPCAQVYPQVYPQDCRSGRPCGQPAARRPAAGSDTTSLTCAPNASGICARIGRNAAAASDHRMHTQPATRPAHHYRDRPMPQPARRPGHAANLAHQSRR